MKNKALVILISLVCALLFILINQMTPFPGQTSGNGNPAIPLITVLFLLFCYLVFLWFKLINIEVKRKPLVFTMTLIAIYWVVAVIYQKASFMAYRNVLADAYKEQFDFVDWDYINQITSFMSIHVNNQYFNVNTYLIFLTASLFIALLLRIFTLRGLFSVHP
ncbi:hypothetical protein [Sporosarcina sp. 6E9]|uniref:hypothetical protein n=1 Tax=Sporosarcina sp. 6E9 TaxID=2819235 RepID=UPI001B307DE7|nr:hypothetical protein [Sporosarcina sp. 6E9]